MKGILSIPYNFGKELGQEARKNFLDNLKDDKFKGVIPSFEISKRQRNNILEYLGVHSNKTKKTFKKFIIIVK